MTEPLTQSLLPEHSLHSFYLIGLCKRCERRRLQLLKQVVRREQKLQPELLSKSFPTLDLIVAQVAAQTGIKKN